MLIMSVALLGCSGSDDSTNCPQGFTGGDCSQKITPTAMYINKIVIKNYPSSNGGNDWDNGEDTSGDNPDMFFVLQSGDQTIYSNEYKTDCTGVQTYVLTSPIGADDVASTISISVWDFDGGDPQTNSVFMSGAAFMLYDAAAFDFPTIRSVVGTNFEADIYVTYEW